MNGVSFALKPVMSTATKFAIITSAGPSVSWRTHPRVEKSSTSNASYGERRGDTSQAIPFPAARKNPQLSPNETRSDDPNWNRPRLTSTFAAQVLGQYLAQDGDGPQSALSAYRGKPHIRPAILFDKKA